MDNFNKMFNHDINDIISNKIKLCIKLLSQEYKFNESDALIKFGFNLNQQTIIDCNIKENDVKEKDVKEKDVKENDEPKIRKMVIPSIVLPFCGVIIDKWCKGIRLNHGLYTQCTNEIKINNLCLTCYKQSINNNNNKPNYGLIYDRLECDLMNYVCPKGKKPIYYGIVMNKLGINKKECIKEAEKFGFKIPEEQFCSIKRIRGRPKMNNELIVSDTDSEKNSQDNVNRKRGRPKKIKKILKINKELDDDSFNNKTDNMSGERVDIIKYLINKFVFNYDENDDNDENLQEKLYI